MTANYANPGPSRAEIDALRGPTLLEFGTSWCGFCRAAQPDIAEAMTHHPQVRHIKVEDGSGRPLGRSFEVRLWPTLIFLMDGVETDCLVRPAGAGDVRQALEKINPSA